MSHEQRSSKLRQVVFLPLFFFLILGLFFPWCTRANALEEPARELAQKMMRVLADREFVTLSMQDRSSLSSSETTAVRQAVESAIVKNGLRLSSDVQAGPHISITVSETLAAYVWIAEVRRNDSSNIFMVKVHRDASPHVLPESASLVIRRDLLWAQNSPILDVVFSSIQSSLRKMLILESKQISFFHWRGDGWLPDGAIPLPRTTTVGRVPRGVLDYRLDALSVTFENEICRQKGPANFEFKCEAAARQLFLPVDEHFASQLIEIETRMGAPVSLARLDLPQGPAVVLTSRDGLARMYEGSAESVATFPGWGTELAAVQSGCGSGWQLLVTGKGDWTIPDTIQAHEIRDHRAVPVSVPAEFAGPIISLRTSDDSRAAVAVVKNLTTHDYEAYHLSIACEK